MQLMYVHTMHERQSMEKIVKCKNIGVLIEY